HVQPARAREGAQIYLGIATNGHVVEYEMAAQRDLTPCPFKVRRGEITRLLVQLDDQLRPALRVGEFDVDETELLDPPPQSRGGSLRAERDLHRVRGSGEPSHQLVHVASSGLGPAWGEPSLA